MYSVNQEIRSALFQIGYKKDMLVNNVSFFTKGGGLYKTEMVAYSSSLRKDTDTAVIAVTKQKDIQNISFQKLQPFLSIATPILMFTEDEKKVKKGIPNVRILGLCDNERNLKKQLKKPVIPITSLKEYIQSKHEVFSPRRLELAKWHAEQLSLFDISPNLIGQAFKIASEELIEKFERSVQSIL